MQQKPINTEVFEMLSNKIGITKGKLKGPFAARLGDRDEG